MIAKVNAKLDVWFGNKWKDWIFGSAGFVFTLFLIPAIFSESKPPLISSIPTWIFLWMTVFAHYENKDYKGSFWTFACGTVWLILALQKLI
jgi:hypothetical protein